MSGGDAVQVGMEPPLLTKKAAASALGISITELDRHARRGAINPKMLGARVMYEPAELRRFAADLPAWEPK